MTRTIDIDELIAKAEEFYPAGLENDDPAYRTTAEFRRLSTMLARAREHIHEDPRQTTWARFCELLRGEFPNCVVWNTYEDLYDPCHGCRVYLPWVTLGHQVEQAECMVVLVSLLAPIYALYASRESSWVRFSAFPARFAQHEARLAALVEGEYGYSRVHEPLLRAPVPDRVPHEGDISLGEATLIDLLFTHERR